VENNLNMTESQFLTTTSLIDQGRPIQISDARLKIMDKQTPKNTNIVFLNVYFRLLRESN
jgi:hypothetical protein